MKRKEFIRVSGRWFMFTALTSLAGWLVMKNKIRLDTSCAQGECCNSCSLFADCIHPAAKKFKNNGEEENI